jgi:hypothetical protein
MVFFGTTAFFAQREIDARRDFKSVPFGATSNAYRYYRFLKNKHETPSAWFKLFLLAQLNFVICIIVFAITLFSQLVR